MIYTFYGSDIGVSKHKARKLVDALMKKRPEATHFTLDGDSFSLDELERLAGSVGLFTPHHIVVLDRVYADIPMDMLDAMAASEHVFVCLEQELGKKDVETLKSKSTKVDEQAQKPQSKTARPNVFALTDAITARDKKNIWVAYQELLFQGVDPEEILPILSWHAKTMLVVAGSKNATEAGVKPFVYTKTKRASQKYTRDELKQFSRDVVGALYQSRQGKHLEYQIEKVLLEL